MHPVELAETLPPRGALGAVAGKLDHLAQADPRRNGIAFVFSQQFHDPFALRLTLSREKRQRIGAAPARDGLVGRQRQGRPHGHRVDVLQFFQRGLPAGSENLAQRLRKGRSEQWHRGTGHGRVQQLAGFQHACVVVPGQRRALP